MNIKYSHWFFSIVTMLFIHGLALVLMLQNNNNVLAGNGTPSDGIAMNVSFMTHAAIIDYVIDKPDITEQNTPSDMPENQERVDTALQTKLNKTIKKPETRPETKKTITQKQTTPDTDPKKSDNPYQSDVAKAGSNQQKSQSNGNRAGITSGNSTNLQNYQATIYAWLEKHKRYPLKALRKRIQGNGSLYFRLDQNGNVVVSEIRKKTGSRILDREIKAMLKRATPMPAPPDIAETGKLDFVIPVSFLIHSP